METTKIKKSKVLQYRIPSLYNLTGALIFSFSPFKFVVPIFLVLAVYCMLKEGAYRQLDEDDFEK